MSAAYSFFNIPLANLPKDLINEIVYLAENLFGRNGPFEQGGDSEDLGTPLTLEKIEVARDNDVADRDSSATFTFANDQYKTSECWGALEITARESDMEAEINEGEDTGTDLMVKFEDCESEEHRNMYNRILKIAMGIVNNAEEVGVETNEDTLSNHDPEPTMDEIEDRMNAGA